jgi:hypothetical protein
VMASPYEKSSLPLAPGVGRLGSGPAIVQLSILRSHLLSEIPHESKLRAWRPRHWKSSRHALIADLERLSHRHLSARQLELAIEAWTLLLLSTPKLRTLERVLRLQALVKKALVPHTSGKKAAERSKERRFRRDERMRKMAKDLVRRGQRKKIAECIQDKFDWRGETKLSLRQIRRVIEPATANS